jgi:S-adenosylmethionine decarboxylase
MKGLHLTAELGHCRCEMVWLTDAALLGRWCVTAVEAAGLQPVGQLFHTFPPTSHGPGGITATVLLAESHLCVHTWPEQRAVSLDVYVCNLGGEHSAQAQSLMAALIERFAPQRTQRSSLVRGDLDEVGDGAA